MSVEKNERLTESEVHSVCKELLKTGQKPTVVKIFNQLKRGSLTTITKMLKTFNDELGDDEAEKLPSIDALSNEAVKSAIDVLIGNIAKVAKEAAQAEFSSERARLEERINKLESEVIEANEFCESQGDLIDELESKNAALIIELKEIHKSVKTEKKLVHTLEIECGRLNGMLETYKTIESQANNANSIPKSSNKKKAEVIPATSTEKASKATKSNESLTFYILNDENCIEKICEEKTTEPFLKMKINTLEMETGKKYTGKSSTNANYKIGDQFRG